MEAVGGFHRQLVQGRRRVRTRSGELRESEEDSGGATRRQMRGVEGASDRRKRKADHNSVRRPAIRFVIVLSSRLARRHPGERDGSVHAFTHVVTRSVLVQLLATCLRGSGVRVLRDSLILHALFRFVYRARSITRQGQCRRAKERTQYSSDATRKRE